MQYIESEDKRVFGRFPVNLSLRFIDLLTDKEGQAQAKDLSAKGVGFLAKEPLKAFTPLEMWLDVPDRGGPLYTRGEVVWSERVGPSLYRTGINLEKADLMGMSRILRTI